MSIKRLSFTILLLAFLIAGCVSRQTAGPTSRYPITLVSTMKPAGSRSPSATLTPAPMSSLTPTPSPFPSPSPSRTLTPFPSPLPSDPPTIVLDNRAGDADPEIVTSLVYAGSHGGRLALYRITDDRTDPALFLESKQDLIHPTWSPAGKQLAYLQTASYQGYQHRPLSTILLLKDQQGIHHLNPQRRMYIHNPVWDPAGLRIAFTGQELDASGYADSGKNIYQVDVITGSIIPLTDSSPGTPGCSSPSWSPGGDELVFVCRGGMAAGLVISRPDGSDTWFYEAGQVDAVTWLPAGDNLAFRGAWHPLGVIDVAFMRSRDPEGNPNYRNLYAILESLPFQEKPIIAYAWSPTRDDLFLVQSSDLIQVVDLSQQEVLSIQGDFKGLEGQFSWGPETKQIAFAFSDGDDAEIGTVHLEQKTFTRVTANDTDDLMPAWQPGP